MIDSHSKSRQPHMGATTMVTIRSVEMPGRGDRLRLDVGADEPIDLAAAVCPLLGAGDEIDAATLRRLIDASADFDVREAALRLLSYRPRSEGELRQRLIRKQFAEERVDRCLRALRDAGVLDDAAFAEAHVRDAVRLRPRGSRRLLAELRRKGVAETTASGAVERVFEEEDSPEADLALRAAEGWARRAGDADRAGLCGNGERTVVERVRRRFWGYMSRRGFAPDAVRSALERICG